MDSDWYSVPDAGDLCSLESTLEQYNVHDVYASVKQLLRLSADPD